jgi:hypothetical protein
MKFSVPVTLTVTGWVEIEAEDLQEAQKKAKDLNDTGVSYVDIQDPEYYTEVYDEVEPLFPTPTEEYEFTPDELALGERMFDLQPESPWTAFCELQESFGDMSLEKRQALHDLIKDKRKQVLWKQCF